MENKPFLKIFDTMASSVFYEWIEEVGESEATRNHIFFFSCADKIVL
jgi:hypothetical protein